MFHRRELSVVAGFALVALAVYATGPHTPPQVGAACPVNDPYDVSKVDWPSLASDLTKFVKDHHDYTPILLRLSWHDSGTYQKSDDSGGSRGAQRFPAGESQHGANAGLHIARGLVQMMKEKYPMVGNADLWALTATIAIKEAGGPTIPFRAGRADAKSAADSMPEGRLPDGDKGASHVRQVFNRMGFNDQEIVALSGGHTIGGCHADRSGFVGDWTSSRATFDNEYFKNLLGCEWVLSKAEPSGNPQMAVGTGAGALPEYECPTKKLMMLTTDYSLVTDPKLKPWVETYASDKDKFFKDFVAAFTKLQENGHHKLKAVKLE